MPSISFEIPHSLGRAGARTRLDRFLDVINEKYQGQISDLNSSWTDDTLSYSFTTYGIKVKGTIGVSDDRVLFHGELPFSAMIFKNKITSGIQAALEKTLDPSASTGPNST